MKAVAYHTSGPTDQHNLLQDVQLETPVAEGRDLLVKVAAVSVNPIDTKVRKSAVPEGMDWRILGFDASGIVASVGSEVENFTPGDAVFYAGSVQRQGTNSEYHLVDERIVGRKPASLSDAEAAALPLTAITAWEMLFDRLDVTRPTPEGEGCILIIGGAGGVGSIAIQLVRALTDLRIIATASRTETQAWVRECGAHHVIDHRQPLAPQIDALGLGAPGFVFSTTQTDTHYADIVTLIAPQGRFGLIDAPDELDIKLLKPKSVSLHWEFMFTRSMFTTPDIEAQGRLLNQIANLVERGKIKTTLTEVAGRIDAAAVRRVHALIESGSARGKIVLEGFK